MSSSASLSVCVGCLPAGRGCCSWPLSGGAGHDASASRELVINIALNPPAESGRPLIPHQYHRAKTQREEKAHHFERVTSLRWRRLGKKLFPELNPKLRWSRDLAKWKGRESYVANNEGKMCLPLHSSRWHWRTFSLFHDLVHLFITFSILSLFVDFNLPQRQGSPACNDPRGFFSLYLFVLEGGKNVQQARCAHNTWTRASTFFVCRGNPRRKNKRRKKIFNMFVFFHPQLFYWINIPIIEINLINE